MLRIQSRPSIVLRAVYILRSNSVTKWRTHLYLSCEKNQHVCWCRSLEAKLAKGRRFLAFEMNLVKVALLARRREAKEELWWLNQNKCK